MHEDTHNTIPSHSHEQGGDNTQSHQHTDGHSHGHSHGGHAGHLHPPMQPAVLAWAMAATLGLVIAEIFGGWLGQRVALLNDSAQILSDVPALEISGPAMRWAMRPPDRDKNYGYRRDGYLAAF